MKYLWSTYASPRNRFWHIVNSDQPHKLTLCGNMPSPQYRQESADVAAIPPTLSQCPACQYEANP